jgi:hypothetical protein
MTLREDTREVVLTVLAVAATLAGAVVAAVLLWSVIYW